MAATENPSVARELEAIRLSVDVGFATLRGDLALALQRTEQTERKLADHEARLEQLEKNRWPLPAVATLASVATVLIAFLAMYRQ